VMLGHEFGGKGNPSRPAFPYTAIYNGDRNLALYHAYYTISTDEEWEQYFKTVLTPRPVDIESNPEAKADREAFKSLRKMSSEKLMETLIPHFDLKIPQDTGGASLEPAAVQIITELSKGRVLELGTGSGRGTKAILLQATGVVTVDHIEKYHLQALTVFVGDSRVTSLYLPLKDGTYSFTEDMGTFDTIVIDGPPGTQARAATFAKITPFLKDDGTIIIDDAKRDKDAINEWVAADNLFVSYIPTNRGVALVAKSKKMPTPTPAPKAWPAPKRGCNCGKKKRAQMPPMIEQIANVASAVGRVAKQATSGDRVLVEARVRNKRLEICKACEHCDGSRCSQCGCFVSAKTLLTSEDCPLGFWT